MSGKVAAVLDFVWRIPPAYTVAAIWIILIAGALGLHVVLERRETSKRSGEWRK